MLGFKFPKEYRVLLAEHMIITETAAIINMVANGVPIDGEQRVTERVQQILNTFELSQDDVSRVLDGR